MARETADARAIRESRLPTYYYADEAEIVGEYAALEAARCREDARRAVERVAGLSPGDEIREIVRRRAAASVARARRWDERARIPMPGRSQLRLALGLLILLAALPAPAAACPRTDDALVLARLAVHEATWRAESDVGPIHEVIAGIAQRRGTTWRLAACAHSPRLTAGTVRRRWVVELDADGTRPPHWPAGSSWPRWRPVWLAVLARARMLVGGAVGPQCERTPETWGSDADIRRAARAGRRPIVVPCGSTANRFVVWGRR